ncbi:MAG: Gfo/Idh/MocA family oxidoreductase, partial [Verrucomicrobia bacterium]|nr:Gfo/Idh/MocA family oxidoreductase [Verrucomicrobiota bacterium]
AMLKQSDTYEVVGVVEPDEAGRKEVAKSNAYRGVNWLTEEQLLNSPGLQVVAIETEVADLVPTATRAIAAGLHIHHDKPGGDSLPQFRGLLKQAEARKQIVQMGYMLRYNPAFQFMYMAVKKGWLGEIMEVDCMMGKLGSKSTREAIGRFPGGGMFELGGHVIDSIVHMLGKPSSVTPFNRRTKSDGVADNQLAVLEFAKATATVRINHNDPFGSPRRRFQISGEKGTIEIQQLESGNISLYLDEPHGRYQKGEQKVQMPRPGGRYDGEFTDLAKVIRGEKQLDWSYSHDLDTQEALLLASGMPLNR